MTKTVKAGIPCQSTSTPGGTGSKTTQAQYKEIHEWPSVAENFALINGGAGHGKSMGSREVSNIMGPSCCKELIHCMESKDISSGVTTVEEKLEKMCFMFLKLDQLFGHCANVVPMHMSQTNVPELESEDEVDGNETNNAMDGKDGSLIDAENVDERNLNNHNERNSNSQDELLAGGKDLDNNPMPPANLSAKPTAGSAPKNQPKTPGKKGKSTVNLDLSSDSDLDSASAIGKNSRTSVSSSAAKPTQTSFASCYMESQVLKLDLMEKHLVAQTKSAEATLVLQREELLLKREMAEKEYATQHLENETKLKAE
ncbi:hypothetical protein HDU81_001150 [Chytriomyces hyalinus]|nr:hypothetical protein HDU81_001150 [Chytriomyces hyalinus]